MKLMVVHFGDSVFRGSERMLISVMKHLASHGHNLYLLCNQPELRLAAKPFCAEVELYSHLPPFGFYDEGFKLRELIHRFSDLASQGLRLLKDWSPDLVICNSLAPSQWMSHCANFRNVPFVVHLHSNPLPHSRATSFAYTAMRIFGVSDFVLEGFRADGVPPSRCIKVPNGVSVPEVLLTRQEARSALNLTLDRVVIASIGALVDFKRFDIAIDAAIEANKSLDGRVCLLVVGDGPLMQQLQSRATSSNVIFLGWRTDIPHIVAACDFVLSTSEREAFGLTLIEAAALHKPAIISSVGGQAEIVENGVTGLHFKPGEVSDCASKIVQLASSLETCDQMGKAAFDRYLKLYTELGMNVLIEKQLGLAIVDHETNSSRRWERLAQGMVQLFSMLFARLLIFVRTKLSFKP